MCRTIRKQHKDEFEKFAYKKYDEWNKYPGPYTDLELYPDAFWYEDIKPVFYGHQVKLELLPALKNANLPGLAEAIDFATVKLTFSGDELRRCNLKDNYLFKYDDKYDQHWDENNILRKGILWFRMVDNDYKNFEKLSEDAKKWFIVHEEKYRYSTTYHISANIPRGYCREVVVPIYINQIKILNSDFLREASWYYDFCTNPAFSRKADHALSRSQYRFYLKSDTTTRNQKQIFEKECQEAIDEAFNKEIIL